MTIVWPLPCHVVNDFVPNNLLISAQKIDHSNRVSDTGLLAISSARINKYVKDLHGIILAGDRDPVTSPMANTDAPPSCSLKDRAVDGGGLYSHSEDISMKENSLLSQSDSHLLGDDNSKTCEKEPASENLELLNAPLQYAGKEASSRNKDSGNLNLDPHSKTTNYSMDPEDAQLANKPAVLGGTASEKKPVSSNVNMDVFAQSRLGGNLSGTDMAMEGQHPSEDVKENAKYLLTAHMERVSDTSSSEHTGHDSSVSLRVWLNNPARVIDKVENLHVFKQIAEFVELAHSQGVVLRNVRPSSFLLSPMSRVSIIESTSSGTSSGSSAESTGRVTAMGFADGKLIGPTMVRPTAKDSASAQQMDYGTQEKLAAAIPVHDLQDAQSAEDNMSSRHASASIGRQESQSGKDKIDAEEHRGRSFTSSSSDHSGDQLNEDKFPLKEILSLELMWYRSPEEINGGTPDFPSDVYSLGVLFLELFCCSASQAEWSRAMSDLRHRLLPPSLLLDHPKEAAFCLLLLHPNPDCRPKARDVLHADIFSEVKDKLVEREAVMNLEEKLTEAETTLDFLLQMQQKKSVVIQKLAGELSLLDEDIQEVERWQALLLKNRQNVSFDNNINGPNESPNSGFGGSKLQNDQSFTCEKVSGSGCSRGGRRQELLLAKSSQLMRSFANLRRAYLSIIRREHQTGSQLTNATIRQAGPRKGSRAEKLGMSRVFNSFGGSKAEQGEIGGRLGCFFDEFCKFMKYSRFDVKATLQYGDILNTKNMVCSVNFDCDDEFFATAGVSKRIKIFDCNALLEVANDVHYPVVEMNSRTKLSCVCWNNFHKNYLASSDLGGVVQLWDVTAGQTIMEFKEHGKCAWSVDFSHSDPAKLASGSDDCCVKIWSTNQGPSVGTIKTKANICSVQFSPDHSHILAFGSADSQVYFHDLRHIRIPVCILTGHQKAVSFIKFAGPTGIVSASTDNTLKLWDLTKTSLNARGYGTSFGSRNDCMTTYTGHTNVKNFVGLSVAEENYIACGSETNEVFVYHKSLPVTMLSHKFKNADPISGQELEDIGDQFVSSVCWRNKSQILVTANSVGNIQVLEMV